MLCTLVDKAFDGARWTFEPKFDGLRILARFDGEALTLLSRNNKPQEARFPEIGEALRPALTRPAIVDGEVICLDDNGKTSFRALQPRFHLDDPAEIRRRMEKHPAFIYLFDILYLDGVDLSRRPLSERREALKQAVAWSDRVRLTESKPGEGIASWKRACEAGEEGIVGKRLDSAYVPGRSDAWVKIKCVGRQEFAIGGWTDPQRSRVGLGALLVGYYEGEKFRFAGKVGTGYTREVLLDLRKRFDEIRRAANPFDLGDPPTGAHWVEPRLVAEIAFAEWTQNGLLRQPRYEGLRPDKSAKECRRERMKSAAVVKTEPLPGATAMPLEEYNRKRDFTKTREPAGARGKKHKQPIFVVQEHHASVQHFDFRLEADGVLKSWSVPKGPSMDPSVKRLAVQVEDHPIGYATFEGTIPQGQYGGGTVKIWDHGTYESLIEDKPEAKTVAEAIEDGHLEFVMHGERLKGKFTLTRMKFRGKGKPQWLLMKSRDEFAEEGSETEARSETEEKSKPALRPKAAARKAARSRNGKAPKTVELTHPDRVIYPEAGLTKKDVFAYYEKIADRLLPFLKDRPITMERVPEGLAERAPHFWQKDTPDYFPDWIPRIELETERGKAVRYALVNDRATLLFLVNQGTLTFHVWASRAKDLDRPDFVLFDLDPGKAPFADVIAVAKAIKATLDGEGVESFVKTSGKTGLHVLTPWTRSGGFDEARALALEFAERTAGAMPKQATVDIRKARRGERVYIDVLQNARGHHAVPPYVLRAVPGATVSTPLDWKEVADGLDPKAFTLKKALARFTRRNTDPFEGLLKTFGGTRRTRAARG